MQEQPEPQSANHTVSSLPPEDYRRLAPHIETLEAARDEVLYRPEQRIDHCYFPLNSRIVKEEFDRVTAAAPDARGSAP